MGNPLRVLRGLEPLEPSLQGLVLPPDWSASDGTFNNLFTNSIRIEGSYPRIRGPMSRSPNLTRLMFQTSEGPTSTFLGIIPGDGGTDSAISVFEGADTLNSSFGTFWALPDKIVLGSSRRGTGPIVPLEFQVADIGRWTVDVNGNFDPAADLTYDIGDATHRVRNIYTSAGSFLNAKSTVDTLIGTSWTTVTGCTLTLPAGTWLILFQVTLHMTTPLTVSAGARIGGNAYGSVQVAYSQAGSMDLALTSVGVVPNTTTFPATINGQCSSNVSNPMAIKDTASGTPGASAITAIRIAP